MLDLLQEHQENYNEKNMEKLAEEWIQKSNLNNLERKMIDL